MKCGRCNGKMNDEEVLCKGCNKDLHFGCSLAERTWHAKSAATKKAWRCSDCRAATNPPPKQLNNERNEDEKIVLEKCEVGNEGSDEKIVFEKCKVRSREEINLGQNLNVEEKFDLILKEMKDIKIIIHLNKHKINK